jgi:REP element-mobilizing transposase RayT
MRKFKHPFISNNCYHIFNRAIGNEKIFLEPTNYYYFLQKLQLYILPVADIFCYNLLPNHFHLFVRIKQLDDINTQFYKLKPKILQQKYDVNRSLFISEQFGNCCNAYTKAFNKKYKRKGKLFIDNLNRRTIDSETYYSKTVHYVHANAVQHGICKRIDAWPYSSYHILTTTQPTWLCREELLGWFGGLKGFLDFHNQEIRLK